LKILYKEGNRLMNDDLNIKSILKDLKNIKMVIYTCFMNEELDFEINHSSRNIINLNPKITD
jgi:hypothetical protein